MGVDANHSTLTSSGAISKRACYKLIMRMVDTGQRPYKGRVQGQASQTCLPCSAAAAGAHAQVRSMQCSVWCKCFTLCIHKQHQLPPNPPSKSFIMWMLASAGAAASTPQLWLCSTAHHQNKWQVHDIKNQWCAARCMGPWRCHR